MKEDMQFIEHDKVPKTIPFEICGKTEEVIGKQIELDLANIRPTIRTAFLFNKRLK